MKTNHRSVRESGQTMVIALILLAITTALAAVAIQRTGGSARMSARSNDFSETERTSDGLIEYAYGAWKAATLAKGAPLGLTFNNAGTATGFDSTTIDTTSKELL